MLAPGRSSLGGDGSATEAKVTGSLSHDAVTTESRSFFDFDDDRPPMRQKTKPKGPCHGCFRHLGIDKDFASHMTRAETFMH